MPFSRGSSQPRDQTQVSCIAGRFFTIWATWETQILPRKQKRGSPSLTSYTTRLFYTEFSYLQLPISEKVVAPHSSTLAWKIPWTEEPGRLQSMGSLRVRQDWATSLSLFTCMHWRRKWQPTPVFLPGESQGQGSLVGCHLWGCTESDMTEAT